MCSSNILSVCMVVLVLGAGSVEMQFLPNLFNQILQPIGRVVNGIADTTVEGIRVLGNTSSGVPLEKGVVRGGFNIINTTFSTVISGAGSVTERIRRLLEEFRKRMNIGIPELGLPILDPLEIDRLDIDFNHEAVSLNGTAENIEVRHLSTFKMDHIEYDLTNRLILNITFPSLDVTGDYDIKGKFGNLFKIFGKGPFWLRLNNLQIGTVSYLRHDFTRLPGIYVDDLHLTVKLGSIENKFENLMNNPKLGDVINKAISQLTPDGIETVWDKIEPAISKMVQEIINNKLQDFEVGNLVGRFFNLFKFNLNQGRLSLKTD